MPELNFNALIPQQDVFQGLMRGQERQLAQETSRFKLDELRRDRDEALQLQTQLKSLGHNGDLNSFFDEIAKTGKPEYVQMAMEGKQKLKDLDAYAKLGGAAPAAMPVGAPAPAAAPSMLRTPSAPASALGSGTFGMEPPVNAMAPAPAAPVNAMAPAPVNALAPQAQQAQKRIDELLAFARTNPRMAKQAMEEARILQDQLELFSRRGPAPVAPTNLAKLQAELAALPANDPRRADYMALIRKETTHAPGTTVQLPPQEKAFDVGLGTGQAKRIIDSQVAAKDAASIIDTVKTGRDIMKSGMITGAGADFLVNLNQGLKTAGIDSGYADASANSQAFAANMAGNVGKLIKQFGSGTALSDADREFAKDMAGGRVSLDSKAINRILDINERAARNVITQHNKDVKGIKTNIPLEVEMPPEIKAPTAANVMTNPKFPGFSIGK